MVVPGSGLVKQQAEEEGLDAVFKDAGFEWRDPGCSMCLGMNPDILLPGERCASTSNRNFEGRQGAGGRTHLVSPEMAAAAAVEHFDIGAQLAHPSTYIIDKEGKIRFAAFQQIFEWAFQEFLAVEPVVVITEPEDAVLSSQSRLL